MMREVLKGRVNFTARKVFTSNVVKYDELDIIEDFSELKLNDMIVVLDNGGHLECVRKFVKLDGEKLIIGNPMISMHDVRSYDINDNERKFYKVKDSKYNTVKRRISVAHTQEMVKELKSI